MKKLISLLILNLCITNTAFSVEKFTPEIQTWVLKKSTISYVVTFPLKTVIGKSTLAKGKAICENNSCEVLVAAPVKSFDSGDTNRDMHMLEITKGSEFPLVTFSAKINNLSSLEKINFDVEFASMKKTFHDVIVKHKSSEKQKAISFTFDMNLSDFKLARPSLLGISIDDKIKISVDSIWNAE